MRYIKELVDGAKLLVDGEELVFRVIENKVGGSEKYYASPRPKILTSDANCESWGNAIEFKDGDTVYLDSWYNTTESFTVIVQNLKCSDAVLFIPTKLVKLIQGKKA